MAQSIETGCIQVMSYLRRRRDITPAQFYDHWENVHAPLIIPWAEKHAIRRYQQVHLNGEIVPVADPASAPNAASKGELPTEPLEFDGIVMFLVPSLEKFQEAFKDPYYVEVIQPDECNLLDKDGLCSGVVASSAGKMIDKINGGKSCIGDKDKDARLKFAEFEHKHGSASRVLSLSVDGYRRNPHDNTHTLTMSLAFRCIAMDVKLRK